MTSTGNTVTSRGSSSITSTGRSPYSGNMNIEWTSSPATLPPPITCGVAKAEKVQAKAVVKPATRPGVESGSRMRQKNPRREAPSILAAW